MTIMKRVHIVGRKNHGKTTLVVELVRWLRDAGYRVGTIKHTHHRHELDTPGKDSFEHRQAGAEVVGVLSHTLSAVFVPLPPVAAAPDRYQTLSPLFESCDLVLVEGDTGASAIKIEVWRACLGTTPLASTDPMIQLIVTDDAFSIATPILARSQIAEVAHWVLSRLELV
jgi:molybdopterin-guanine dinucleotide biosynthesis protein MobB